MKYVYVREQKSLAERIRDNYAQKAALAEAMESKKNRRLIIKNFLHSILMGSLVGLVMIGIVVLGSFMN
ncbi:hypothetical protein LIS82_27085 (plasmid) [Cytobacillus solani]|uniref:hypothetical protein n=1 Tax=Cytobacillus solani TaxID=1637975 RepID=UPI0020799FC2|nr:hypothetical protein [Cytobacillus solani]USK57874.1 hypothetical protein LIS82_27085 [Cytobacillus solani]